MAIASLEARFNSAVWQACRPQNRYRTMLVIGPPRSGKTTLVKQFCRTYTWQYINFALEPGCFESITSIETFSPTLLVENLLNLTEAIVENDPSNAQRGLVVDEIECVLSTWRSDIQDAFFSQVTRLTNQACGLILSTRLRTQTNTLRVFVKNDQQVFNIIGE